VVVVTVTQRITESCVLDEDVVRGRVCQDTNGNNRCEDDERGMVGIYVVSAHGTRVRIEKENGEFSIRTPLSGMLLLMDDQGKLVENAPVVEARDGVEIPVYQTSSFSILGEPTFGALCFGLPLFALAAFFALGHERIANEIRKFRSRWMDSERFARLTSNLELTERIRANVTRSKPHDVVAQVIADVLGETMIYGSGQMHLVKISALPVPHFVYEDDRRGYIFATNLRMLRNLPRHTAVRLADVSPVADIEVDALWDMLQRNAGEEAFSESTFIPRLSHWQVGIYKLDKKKR